VAGVPGLAEAVAVSFREPAPVHAEAAVP